MSEARDRIEELAVRLDDAVRTATAIPQLSADDPLTLDEAYAVQRGGIALRVGRGDLVVGVKLGFTSEAKARQMGVSDVIIGQLTASTEVSGGGTVDLATMVHPRVEPEVAFRLGADLPPDLEDPLSTVSDVAAALEIIDSRYRDFRFSLEDVVADNTSAAGFVLGEWLPFADHRERLAGAKVTLAFDGETREQGSTSAILGDPLRAVAAAQRMAAHYDLALPAGSIILAGAATAAVAMEPGVLVEGTVAGLGLVSVRTGGDRA
ncbi:2-keto-4-pentenoate hydratase [Nocardioides sp. Root151]|uniref:2-keto-4-pentenoate hydratase n=1 Tax=Nocardioides sp. Root151 TaxID=1736475 RepID=UPI000703246B|nr:fumarylacetoacetate hydrolase family protein [Nocardioides sp. Root151]KQZ67616.1 4-oxalocrotonate decarboxylase [Nocardioides sp. Root151]